MRFAAEFDDLLVRKLRRLSLDVPVAETCRQLGREAARLGLHRPSYAACRLHVEHERFRRAERDATLEVAALLAFTRVITPTLEGIAAEHERAVRRRLRSY